MTPGKQLTLSRRSIMRWKLGKQILKSVGAILIMACFMPSAAGAFGPGNGNQGNGFHEQGRQRTPLGIWKNPAIVKTLKLTETQIDQMREADFAFKEKQLTLKAQLDRERLQLDKALSAASADEAAIVALAKQVADTKGKMFVQSIESRLELEKLLSKAQIETLKMDGMPDRCEGPRHKRKQLSKWHRQYGEKDFNLGQSN
jgi:Spy/CpxP family protein refolding chaperone